jgi:hypothetical protein
LATRKSNSSARLPARLAAAAAYLWGPGRTATLLVLLVAGFSVGAWLVWQRVEKQERARYILTVDQIEVTPKPPKWIHTDVRAEGFRNASRDRPLSLLDDDLTDLLHRAFELLPWVAKVNSVTKRFGRVDVDLVYRQPVCVVEVPGDLLPVDADGVLLPSGDLTPIEKQQSYPCLVGIQTSPMRPAGQPWGDGRVLDGAQIAAAFGPAWQALKLYRIQPAPDPAEGAPDEPACLFTPAGTRIVWGLAPTTKVLGEPSAAEKVARLQQYAAAHGGLDGRDGPQQLDVRALPAAKKP